MNEQNNTNTPDQWAIVELLGHVVVAGKISEQDFGGSKMIRIDAPTGDGFSTQLIGSSAVYRIRIVDEVTACAAHRDASPVSEWNLRQELARRGIALIEPPECPALTPITTDEEDARTNRLEHALQKVRELVRVGLDTWEGTYEMGDLFQRMLILLEDADIDPAPLSGVPDE